MKNNLEKFRPLLMGLINGKLTAKEAIVVNEALIRSAKLREEYERLLETAKKLDTPSFVEPTDKIVCKISPSPYHRFFQDAGVWLVIGGYALLVGYSVFQTITGDGRLVPRVATITILLGIAILLFIFIRKRVQTHKTDPYNEVER